MDKSERIYVAPKRGRLPRRYEFEHRWSAGKKVRVLAACMAVGAGFWGFVYWVVKP